MASPIQVYLDLQQEKGRGAEAAAHLREEGRLAALAGDRAEAISAYRHYLALRSDPEPVLRSKVDEVRAELAKLVGKS